MPSVAEVVRQLWGAWRLARGDAAGVKVFGDDTRSFWQSFTAAGIVLPLYLTITWLHPGAMGKIEHPARFWLAELAMYANVWVAFPFVMLPLTQWMDCEDRYIRFICAYNWASVLQSALQLFIVLLGAAGLLPNAGEQFLGTLVLIAVLLYGWFIAKTALNIPALHAVGVVFVDFMLGIVLQTIGEVLKYG